MTRAVRLDLDFRCVFCRQEVVGPSFVDNLSIVHETCREGYERGRLARADVARENLLMEKFRLERERDPAYLAQVREIERRSQLPSEHPEHSCGMMCDGQDGMNSECSRIRVKLGFK